MRQQHIDLGFAKLSLPERLQRLEDFLTENGLTPPQSVGDISAGEPEILDLVDLYWNGDYFADMVFLVRWAPGRDPAPFVMRSSKGGAGAVFVPLIDGHIALVRQFRPCLGRWTWEIPRGFSETWEPARTGEILLPATSIPKGFATAMGELVQEVGNGDFVEPIYLGEIAENSGTTTTSPNYWLLHLRDVVIGGSEGLKIKLVKKESLSSLIGKEIRDNHSIVACTLTLKSLGVWA